MRRHDFDLPEPITGDRPGDNWVCGHADEGAACGHGPSAAGKCPAAGACRPIASAGGWRCARPPCLGGPCDDGPNSAGACALRPGPCVPRPSWRLQRRRISVACLAASAAALLLMIGFPWRHEPLRPGPLAAPHAQILGSRLASDRCAACHPAALGSLASWFTSAGDAHAHVTQSQLCMDCHHATIDRERATLAHQLTVSERARLRTVRSHATDTWHDWLPAAAVDMDNVQCATCHREHHGATADLASLTDLQCQSCHQDRFGRFADSHPDWHGWPYGRREAIAFDHASHFAKHFPASSESAQWDCRACHAATDNGQFARSGTYESTCAGCHDDALRIEAAGGIDLLALPSLPQAEAADVGVWPAAAQGVYSGGVSPLTRLLIDGDPAVAQALAALPDDWERIEAEDPAQRKAAVQVAAAIGRLLNDIAEQGSAAIARRAGDRGISEATAQQLAAALSPQLVLDAYARWFAASSQQQARAGRPRRLSFDALRLVADFRIAPVNPLRAAGRPPLHPPLALAPPEQHPGAPHRWAHADDDPLLAPAQQPPLLAHPQAGDPLSLSEPSDDPLLSEPLLSDPLLNDSLLHDPLLNDSLLSEPLAQPRTDEAGSPVTQREAGRAAFDPALLSPVGGWYRDEVRLAIAYRGGGHADPVLRAAIELAWQLPTADPLAAKLLSHRALAICADCHQRADRGGPMQWVSGASATASRSFTRFSHRPHKHLPLLSDCVHCHRVRSPVRDSAANTTADDFLPLERQTCAACHTSSAAGESCTQCHRYHVQADAVLPVRSQPPREPTR